MRAYPFLGKFTVSSLYGYRAQIETKEGTTSTKHCGIDLVGKGNINCVACEAGTVVFTRESDALGKYIWITTDSGYGMLYQHLKSFSVKAGDRVKCKQVVGVMGNTGRSTGAHLHFGVATNTTWDRSYFGNSWINPAVWWGIANPGEIKGKTFDGSGYITGNDEDTNSTNNTAASVTVDSSTSVSYGTTLVPSGEYYQIADETGVYGDWLYGRRYRVAIDIGGNKVFDVSELRCKFEISKTVYGEPNSSKLTIYNLSPDDENKLIQEGQRIIIEAGYNGSQYGLIFSGNIIQPLRSKENGTDYLLTLVSMDSERYMTYGLVGVSLVAQQSSRDAINTLISSSSQEVGTGFLTNSTIKYPRGKVMFGMSKDYLEQISRTENCTFYTDDGKLNIISAQDIESERILDFNPQTGLIGTPTQTSLGIQCQVLLNPQIKLNSLFHVDNSRITNYEYTQGNPVYSLDSEGIYRVISLKHVGDTRSNDWYTEIEAISQAGLLPSTQSSSSIYGW